MLKTTFAFLCVTMIGLFIGRSSPSGDAAFKLTAKCSAEKIEFGDEIELGITLSSSSPDEKSFLLGSDAQVFGFYILGPWGPVQPDSTKVLPANWMHQAHSTAREIKLLKTKSFETKIKLSDYFKVTDAQAFKAGNYQLNVKFFDASLGMTSPIDSGPIHFKVIQKEAKTR